MGLVPAKAIERLQYYENHEGGWAAAAVSIGTTTSAVTDLTTKAASARDAYDAHQAAQDAARTATQAWHQAMVTLSTAGAAIIDQIRSKAKMSGDQIWTLANLPAPSTPAPVGPPGKPYQLKVALVGGGALDLKWKANNPPGSQGTMYQISRKVDGAANFSFVAATGAKKFTDNTLPAGTSSVIYEIRGVRSTAIGEKEEFLISIGVSGGGEMTASVVEPGGAPTGPTGPTKMAA